MHRKQQTGPSRWTGKYGRHDASCPGTGGIRWLRWREGMKGFATLHTAQQALILTDNWYETELCQDSLLSDIADTGSR